MDPRIRPTSSSSLSQRTDHYAQQRSALTAPPNVRTYSSHSARSQNRPTIDGALVEVEETEGLEGPSAIPRVPAPARTESKDSSWYKHSSLGSDGSGERDLGSKHGSLLHPTRRRAEDRKGQAVPMSFGSLNGVKPGTISIERGVSRDGNTVQGGRQKSRGSTRHSQRNVTHGTLEEELTALPPAIERHKEVSLREDTSSSTLRQGGHASTSTRSVVSRTATELYTISYLIFFAILGTLARLGLQWLTFYPGAPVVLGVLWANFAGSLFMGFLAEDQKLFKEEWGETKGDSHLEKLEHTDPIEAKARHLRVKKTIPLYIGLSTGFCGSFTSFSSFMRDVFFALSNNLASPINHPYSGPISPSSTSTIPRNGGYSVMAVLAVIILTTTVCLAALKTGAHLALFTHRFTPTIPFRLQRRVLDNAIVIVAWGAWAGAILMAIFPPDRPNGPASRGSWASETWRGQAVFACVFAPAGCLLRFYVSLHLNGIVPSFPLGTFAANMFGTAVLGMAYDLQHIRMAGGLVGGGRVGCQVLQGLMDGFDGCLTTVSTWVAELTALRRASAYVYGVVSVGVGLGLLVMIMGSVRWTVGFEVPACVV